MACLSGGESRRWTVGELLERFKNLGICASRASVTAALAELGLELELSGWAPWRLLERGTEWILAPKSELLELLSGVRRLPVKEAMILSEEHKAVLLVVIGYRQRTLYEQGALFQVRPDISGGKTGVRHGGDTHRPKWPP